MKEKIYKLKNGGILIYEKSKLNNSSAVEVGFLAGSFNEKKMGTAHLLEHTLFKKTKNRTNKQVEQDRNKIVFLNASTSMDYLVIKFFRTNKLICESFKFAYDVLMNSIVDDEFLETEKNVIIEELLMCEDSESRDIFVKNLKQAVSNSKSASDIVGKTASNIKSISFKDLLEFKRKFFIGNYFVCSIVTSLPAYKVKKMINNIYVKNIEYSLKAKTLKKYYDNHNVNRESSVKIYKNNQEKVTVLISIKFDANELDIFAKNYNYVFLSRYFAGAQGDLFLKLRNLGLIYRLDSEIASFKTNSLFNIVFETSKEKIKDIIEIIANEVNFVTQNLIESDKIKSYKQNLEYSNDEKMPTKMTSKCHSNLLDYICYQKVFHLTKKQKMKLRNDISSEKVRLAAKEIFNKKNEIFVTALGNVTKSYLPTLEYFKSKFLIME